MEGVQEGSMVKTNARIYRNTCPRNCYSNCSLLSYVDNGVLLKVEGDRNHGYTLGRLCAEGYALVRNVYHPERLRYPMRQVPRGSGHWQKIDWDKALELIASQILSLNKRYGSNLSLGYYKDCRPMNLQSYSVDNFFQSIGSSTCLVGGLEERAGYRAQLKDFGKVAMPDPENMAKAKYIVLWGVNPLTNGVHQWFFINRARDLGAKLVVIDQDFTSTGAHGDVFIQVKPGTDGYLALAVCKLLVEEGAVAHDFVAKRATRWREFREYLTKEVDLERAQVVTGLSLEAMRELADVYRSKSVATWIGSGVEKYSQGYNTVRAIDALAAATGQLSSFAGGGVYYLNPKDCFSPIFVEKKGNHQRQVRQERFPEEACQLDDPPLKFLWIDGCDPLSSGSQKEQWQKLFLQLELVVTVDVLMTETAASSDLVLPAASFFEDYDLNFSYWHNWVSINEKAIPNFYEGKSSLEIMRMLAGRLNQFSPGFSTFPAGFSSLDLIRKGLNQDVKRLLDIANWRELLKGPRRLNVKPLPWVDNIFLTPSRKYEFFDGWSIVSQ